MTTFRRLAIFASVLLAVACADSSVPTDTDGTWVGTITTEGNVTTVINESGSVWGGTAALVEEASIGVDIGAQPYMLADIASMAATEDRIYLLEQSPPVVRVYDLEGTHLMDIGSEGQGPGELSQPMSIGVRPDGRLLVRDDGNARMHVFSTDGELVEDWPLPGGFMTSHQIVVMSDGTVYTWLPAGEDVEGRRRRGMVPFGIDGAPGEAVFLPEVEGRLTLGQATSTSSSGARRIMTVSVPFSPGTSSVLSPAGGMIVGVGDKYRFEVRDLDGDTLVVERATVPIAVLPEESSWHERYTTARARGVDPSWSWDGPRVPTNKPFFNQFYPDQSGRIWVQRPGPGRHMEACDEEPLPGPIPSFVRCWEDSHIVDVFASDGRFLGVADLPEVGLVRPGWIFVRGDLVLLRLEDEAGTIMVKRYRLVLPGEEAP